MFEGAVVNYVVPDALQSTAHAHVSVLMRFVTLFLSVQLFGFHSDTNPTHTHQESVVVRWRVCGVPAWTSIRT